MQPIGKEAVISITLNTAITNETVDGDGVTVMGLTYTAGGLTGNPDLGTPEIMWGRVRKYSRTVAPRSRGLSPPTAMVV